MAVYAGPLNHLTTVRSSLTLNFDISHKLMMLFISENYYYYIMLFAFRYF